MGRNKRGGRVVYSTNENFEYDDDNEEEETLPVEDQLLYVSLDTKKRKGKTVTLVEGFVGRKDDLNELGKLLKSKCGVGGSAKDGEIIIQGNLKSKVAEILQKEGYKIKLKG
ncbi:MAG: translation initiation factor [Bacteroidetes bacterium]|nr:translation initiation factor [Bacteroidota bacterium]